MSFRPSRFVYVCGILLQLLATACSKPVPASTDAQIFDRIISKSSLLEHMERKVDLQFRVATDADRRLYEAVYAFPATRPDQHYVCAVTVAPAGTLLDPKQYSDVRAELAQRGDDEARRRLATEFPQIGLRAMLDAGSFGPGGASYGLTMTTADQKFDVKVSVSNLMPEGVPDPKLDLAGTARMISDRYDAETSRR
jgi:hypothetical protein